MESNDSVANQLGVCTYLIDKLALRIGNEKGEDEADTVGCCSLRVEHIKFFRDNECLIELNFLGKDSMQYKNSVEIDLLVAKHLRKFCEAKQPKDDIFDKINAGRLNDYMKESMESLSAKVFRTYNASYTLQNELNKGNLNPDKDSVETKTKFYDDCNRKVAILCNHQKSVPKGHEAQITKMNDKLTIKQT